VDNHKKLRLSTAVVLSHFCNKTIKSDNLLSDYLVNILARQLSDSYKIIYEKPIDTYGSMFSISMPEFDSNQYTGQEAHLLSNIYRLVNREVDLFSGVYLHGSMATLDYISGWSDVDILMVIPRNVLTNSHSLIELRNTIKQVNEIVFKICQFQHHGVMLICEDDLNDYSGHTLPVEVFSYMKSMKKGVSVIRGHLSSNLDQKTERFFRVLDFIIKTNEESVMMSHAYNGEYLLAEYKNAANGMYQFKYYIEQFMLLPALYLSAIGKDCYKKYSFELIRDVFPSEAIELIDLVSRVRYEWKDSSYDYGSNHIPSWIRHMVPKDYFQIGADIANNIKIKLL